MKLNAAGEYLDQFDHRDQRRLREQDRPPACEDGDAADWDRRSIAIRAPPDPSPATRSILLRVMEITRPNQVWAMEITYILMAIGFADLAVVLDCAARRGLLWRLSITMNFCVERRRIPWLVPASRTSSTRLRLSVHWTGFYRRGRRQRYCDQHGRNGAC